MLAADKQLLDAQLRNELQQLRKTELDNVVQRFQNALVPATLIAGFSYTAIVELESLTGTAARQSYVAEPVFYIFTATALALALLVTVLASMGVIFGQRLMVQANADQGSRHKELVDELNNKVLVVLVALAFSMVCVVIASVAVIWVKVPYSDGEFHTTSWIATIIVSIIFIAATLLSAHMFFRLFSCSAASSNLSLRASKARFGQGGSSSGSAPVTGQRIDEFFVTEDVRQEALRAQAAATAAGHPKSKDPSERSALLTKGENESCFGRDAKRS